MQEIIDKLKLKPTWTAREISKITGMSVRTVYRRIESGEFDVERFSPKKARILSPSIIAYLERLENIL